MIVRKLIVLVGKGVITVKAIVGSSTLFLSVVLALMVCTGGVGYGADLNIDWTKQYARMGLMTIGGYTATSGASSYCTGDGTCTATYPGNCNLLCEDFEGSTQCYSGYDSVCRRAAYSVYLTGTGAIDYTTAHSGSFSCTDKGSNALRASHSSSTSWANTSLQIATSEQSIVYGQVYVYVETMTLSASSRQSIFRMTSSAGNASYMVNVINLSDKFYFEFMSAGMTAITSSEITTGTWYRIQWVADNNNDTFTAYLNGSQIGSTSTNFTTSNLQRYLELGSNDYRSATAFSVQYDNIALSSSALPGACNQ